LTQFNTESLAANLEHSHPVTEAIRGANTITLTNINTLERSDWTEDSPCIVLTHS